MEADNPNNGGGLAQNPIASVQAKFKEVETRFRGWLAKQSLPVEAAIGGHFQFGKKFSQPPAEYVYYPKTRSMLSNFGLRNYDKNIKRGLLTDTTLPLNVYFVFEESDPIYSKTGRGGFSIALKEKYSSGIFNNPTESHIGEQTEEGGENKSTSDHAFNLIEGQMEGQAEHQTPNIDELLKQNYRSLVDSPDDPNVWTKRGNLVSKYCVYWEEDLDRTEKFAEQHPNSYLFWDYRRWFVGEIGYEARTPELEFTKKILSAKGTRNYQVWSHRQWILKKCAKRLWLDELKYCHEILEKDKFNVYAWDQIYHAVRLQPDIRDVHREKGTTYAKKAICAQPGNEGPWIYLKFLYADDMKRLFTNPDLECIYVDVLAEVADRLKSLVALDPHYKLPYASVDSRGCVHALSLIVDLMALGYQAGRNTRLVEVVDFLFDKSRPLYTRERVPELIQRMNS